MLLREGGTVVESAFLEALPKASLIEAQRKARKCARAMVLDQFPAQLAIVETAVSLRLSDLSVLTDDAPGGLGVLVDVAQSQRLPLGEWNDATMCQIHLRFPAEITAQSIPARARVVRVLPRMPSGHVIAFQYWLDRMRDEAFVQRFWMRCQLLERMLVATQTPAKKA